MEDFLPPHPTAFGEEFQPWTPQATSPSLPSSYEREEPTSSLDQGPFVEYRSDPRILNPLPDLSLFNCDNTSLIASFEPNVEDSHYDAPMYYRGADAMVEPHECQLSTLNYGFAGQEAPDVALGGIELPINWQDGDGISEGLEELLPPPLEGDRSVPCAPEPAGHHKCAECDLTVVYRLHLWDHGRDSGHNPYDCRVEGCPFVYLEYKDYRAHVKAAHPEQFICDECKETFSTKIGLIRHAIDTGHAAFVCGHEGCESSFSRYDTYERHQKIHQDDIKRYPCKYCKKHRGLDGFKRKDHLTQHLRNYHHIGEENATLNVTGRSCRHEGCPHYREPHVYLWEAPPGGFAFDKISDYTKHMKKDHDESEFPCPEPGCNRVGGKGYFRKRDLVAHQKKVHGALNNVDAEQEAQ